MEKDVKRVRNSEDVTEPGCGKLGEKWLPFTASVEEEKDLMRGAPVMEDSFSGPGTHTLVKL